METFELRYFVAVARRESVHRAAEDIAVSPAALSKAVARLEAELGAPLFERLGRGLRLTADGRTLAARAAEILELEEAARVAIQGRGAAVTVRVAAPEILLAQVGLDLVRRVRRVLPQALFTFIQATEAETERLVREREAHLGVTTAPVGPGLTRKALFETAFQTCVGRGHALYKAARDGRVVPVADILAHAFVCPGRPLLGHTGRAPSLDGWRDDKLPRRIDFVAGSLALVEQLVTSGTALAYLPDYYVEQIPAAVLKISGCPYTCRQTASLIARDPRQSSWLAAIFA